MDSPLSLLVRSFDDLIVSSMVIFLERSLRRGFGMFTSNIPKNVCIDAFD